MSSAKSPLPASLLGAVLASMFGSLQVGYHTGNVNAPAEVIEEFFNVTWRSRHGEWIPERTLRVLWSLSVSIKDLGALLGLLGVTYLADAHGRRNSILMVNFLSVAGAVLMLLSKVMGSLEVLILGRLVFGVFSGLVFSLNPLYIQEVSPTNLRGAFATLNQVAFALGNLVGMVAGQETALGTAHQWDLMLSLSLIPAALQYLLLPFCPESPRYLLLTRGQEACAQAALLRLRGDAATVEAELREMKEEASHTQAAISIQQFFCHTRYQRPILLVLAVSLGSQLSGFNAVINYSTKIFQETFSEAKYLTLGVAAMNVVFTLVAFVLMEKAGRRKLLLTGFLSLAVCNLLMTVVDTTLTVAPDIRYLQVIVVFSLVSAYGIGPGPISWFIAAELFEQPSRPIAMAFTSMLNWGGKFVLAFVYPQLQLLWHGYVYLVFMAVALMAFGIIWYRLPETKGRSFHDIAEEFRGAEGILLRNKSDFNTFN